MAVIPKAPEHLGLAGKKLWRSVLSEFDVAGAERELVSDACAIADQQEALREMMRLGPMMKGPDGMPRANPAMVQFRLLSITKARLLAAAQVVGEVKGEEHDPSRPQKRAGVRGVHPGGLRAVK